MKLVLQNIQKSFDLDSQGRKLLVIDSISFTIKQGELVCIVGPSGCGKTTLFNIIAGIDVADSGKILLDGKNADSRNGYIGYMMQRDVLLPWRNILDNVLLGVEIRHKRTPAFLNEVKELLTEYGIAEFAGFYPNALSGGMRQKAALIRTLIVDPQILLFDEPFAHIDYETRLDLECSVYDVVKNKNKTALFVTHDIDEAIAMGDRVFVMTRRPARIFSEYKIDLGLSKRNPVSARESQLFRDYFVTIWDDFKRANTSTHLKS